MKRIITTAVALIIAFSVTSGSEAEAGRRNNNNRRIFASNRVSNGGFFQNVMELERRKNAWLRATFLGR